MLTGVGSKITAKKKYLLAKLLIAGSVFLLPMQSALAAPTINLTSSFLAADGARTYMDIGGTWNGSTEVTNGDGFTLSVSNTGTDPAFDISDIPVTVPAGFVLASTSVTVTDNDAGSTCPDISASASQVSAGNPVTIDIASNSSTAINPTCSYNFAFRLATDTSATAGTQSIGYTFTYNTIDDDAGSAINVNDTQNIDVNAGGLSITKTTATTSAITNDVISYDITVSSTGTGGLFDVRLNDILSSDLSGLTFTVPNFPPGANGTGTDYIFEYLAAGEVVNLTVDATVTPVLACPVLQNSADLSERTSIATDSVGPVTVAFDFQFTNGATSNVISHAASSYCEFCGDGTISITVQNPTNASLTNISLLENLQASGLVYISGSTLINGSSAADPGIGGGSNEMLTWNLSDLGGLGSHVISFGVRSANAESLISAVRNIIATVNFDMSCLAATQTVDTGDFEVPIRQPVPAIFKDGRNFDAGQGGYSDPIYGNENDDVIWRVNVQNAGLANMEALRMNDSIDGNFTIGSICPTEADAVATATAGGGVISPCISMASPFNVVDPFGNAADPDDITARSSDAFIYYVGRIQAAHTNNTNTNDISWGCAVDSPTGGSITTPASTGGATPGVTILETGVLNTTVVPGSLQITQTVTGSNTGQPLGTKGLVTVVINNQTGGTVTDVSLQNIVPDGYVIDETFGSQTAPADCDCTVIFDPAYGPPGGTYPGFIDTVLRDDAERDNGNPVDDLTPNFTFTSSSTGADVNQVNLFRHGDIVTLTFGIVMIDPVRFDLVADLDVVPENTADGTDPTNALALSSTATVSFNASDAAGLQSQSENNVLNFNANPEDLDVAISDALFILTNDPGTPLNLNVLVTNNGLHDADDYTVYVTLGQAMTVTGTPSGCVAVTPPAPPNASIHPLWNQPSYLPATAAVFACDRGTIEPAPAPGSTETFTFTVVKASGATDDDLTFRADVVGEVTLADGTALTFSGPAGAPNLTPPSLANTTPNQQLANNYTLDGVRSRVLGFNLVKSAWYCAEDGAGQPAVPADILSAAAGPPNTPTMTGNLNSQMGEDCAYRIEAGGWFGFDTPGFTLIEVNDIAVTDDLPNLQPGLDQGQGFIPFSGSSSYNYTTTDFPAGVIALVGADGGAGTTPLNATDITWNFNAAGNGITVKDQFFRVDLKTRLLNDSVDLAYPVPGGFGPNLHGNPSTNISRASFTAVFDTETIVVNDGAGIPGYPDPSVRTVTLTDVEPNLIVTKQVCNESLNGTGPTCSVFADSINDGDTNDSYIYRITLLNEGSTPVRSPAFNIISTDTLDASDLMFVVDFANDGLDNNGDGSAADGDAGETAMYAAISDNIVGNATPAVITLNESFGAPFVQLDPGTTITFYYRVDPDISIAPLQLLTNTVSMSFDSLDGDSGNQSAPQYLNGEASPNDVGRARIYTSIAQVANVTMIPLLAQPKTVLRLSNTLLGAAPHNVSVGEEVEYELDAELPVANLRQFKIRDELPPGVRCIEGQVVNLNAPPYDAAGFSPGGTFASTCTSTGANDYVEWNFGDQAVTASMPGNRFHFPVTFIARVENTAVTTEGVSLINGGGTVDTTPPPSSLYCTGGVAVCYVNDAGNVVALDFAAVSLTVREPLIALTKSFAVTNSDAADILTVTVTATNNGTAAAYNLQVLDALTGSDLTYINDSMAGTDAPDDDGVAADSKNPVFRWNISNPDYEILTGAGNAKTFTFQVRVDTTAQPLEILDNTIQGKWDSLPDLNTALNTISNTIGADGSTLGLRNGAVPNAVDAINDYETTASDSTLVLPLTMSKTDLSVGTVVPTIGAHRNFEVIINLPEGTTEDLIIQDALIFSGVSYFLRRDGAAFDITYTFEDIVSINGLTPAEAVFRGATAGTPTLPVDGDAGTISWDIGTIITAEENDIATNAVNPRIVINYFARPNNDAATNVGVNLQNSATTTYDNGETAGTETLNDTSAVQTVLEPLLTISKTVSNITNGGVGPVAGDVLEYQISISNAGNSEAFDSNIVDTLDANTLLDASFTPTVNGVAIVGFNATPTGTPAGLLIWGRDNVDNSLDIPVGQTLVLTYRVIVQNTIEANVVISNSVLVDWTSLDDTDPSSAFERTGLGCPAITAPNDYCSAPAVASITANDSNSIVKTIIFDTYDEASLSNATDSIVRVGDIATYRLEVNIQQGTTVSANLLDAIPAGMEFVDVVSINGDTTAPYESPTSGVGSNFSYAAIPAGDVPSANNRLTLNWSLGNISNDFSGDSTTDSLVIEYRVRVFENDGDTIAQVPSTLLTNSVNFTYIDGNGSPSPGDPRLTDTAVLTVLQPLMDALTKTDRSGRVSGDPVDVANDIMNFRLHSCNTTGLARAYGLLLTDTLPMELNETTLAGPNNGALAPDVYINNVLVTEGAANDYVYTPPARGGDMVFRFNTPIDPGICVDIDFDITFYTDFGFGSFSNQVVVDEYYSLPPANAQLYGPLGPAVFVMNNPATAIPPPAKVKLSADEATVGDEVVYQITVPDVATGAILYDVTITDVLDASLLYVSAIDTGANGFTITDTVLAGNTVNLVIDQIPAGQQAVIELRARVDNNLSANAGVNFQNSASYTYATSVGGTQVNAGNDSTVNALSITEPSLALAKAFTNISKAGAPDAGDILRYTVTLTAAGGALAPTDYFSDAFDLIIDDGLSLGLTYINNSVTINGGNTINQPAIVGDGIVTPQTLNWSPANLDDIDVTEGTVVTLTYDVLVLDSVLANQNLSNSVDIQWSSRDGPDVNERNGSGAPDITDVNDYFNLTSAATLQTTPDNNNITKSRISDTFNPVDNIVRIGDIVEYQLVINLQEGTSANFIVRDDLPQGLQFEQTVSINGQTIAPYSAVAPFSHSNIPAAVVSGNSSTGATTVSWNAGDVINAGDNNITNDDFVIVYRARVLNLVYAQQNNMPLTNTVNFDYDLATGAAGTEVSSQTLDMQQPNLSVTKSSVPVAGSVIGAGDLVTYTVDILNSGATVAYDTELLDTIPFGLRSPAINVISTTLQPSGVVLTNLAPVYNSATGTANWNFDTGTADLYNIPAGESLRIVYQVQADAGLGAGLSMTNAAQVPFYYSFDNDAPPSVPPITGVREIYGPSNTATVTLTTVQPNALLKENPTDLNVSIGETFSYRITIPGTLQATALYDVRILDDLTASAADLMFVSATKVSGSQTFTPVNIGTVTDNLIIADVTNGIDIPANEQVEIDITVTLRDNATTNVAPLPFTNAASYTFNQINDNDATVANGLGNTTPVMTIVEPDLTLDKRGPAGTVNFLAPIPFTVVVENIGTGPAFDTTVTDQLPDVPDNPPLTGGTCDALPINIVANITDAAEAVIRPLVVGTDYTATHTAAPTCELVITALTDTARIEATEKLIVSYQTTLDVATQSGAALSNIAGATQWFSLDTAGAGATGETRTYSRIITDGTPAVIDHEDVFTVIVEAPVLEFQKTVFNTTTGLPGTDASPGDTLRYSVTVQNIGPTPLANFSLTDEVDGLAPASGFFAGGSMTNFVIPAGADNTNTDINSGVNAAGLLDVRNLSIDAAGGANDALLIQFDVTLLPVIDSGTIVLNQAQINSPSTGVLLSDDPNQAGAVDPTPTLITSAPVFIVQKTSLDITGDPALLLAGDTLRYTLTVKNIGQENAVNSLLNDQIPANTVYAANSTRLNGVIVADPAAGVSPLAAGMLINAPENTTAGFLRADINPAANNVATVTFDVVISATTVNGTLISNQGFFAGSGAGSGVFPQQPSDDPGTTLVDDPTIDVVGNVPVVDALKTVVIQTDVNSNGIVDPGDTLRYTITTSNIGARAANNVVLTDTVPLNTTYVADSVTLNTLPVGQPDAGVSPLIAGIAMSSSNLTPPLPAAGNGVLSPASSAVVTFDVVVNAGTAPGTIISNQGFVASNELPTEPTDADGNGANGNQPTVVVVGNVQQLAITKQVFVIGGGAAEAGNQLEYVVRVTNIGGIAASNVIITDDMDLPVVGQKVYLAGSGLLNGLPAGISFVGSVLTANIGNLASAAVAELRFRVTLNASLNIGDTVINTADVVWDAPAKTLSASASIDVGGTPGSANLNGQVWHDADFSNDVGANEILLPNYRVQLYRNNTLLGATVTDANGVFFFSGLPPNMPTGDAYELRYLAPAATATTASLGDTNSAFTDGAQRISNIFAASGTNVQNLNLPRQVNGVIYDSVLRVPVAGVRLTMVNQTRSNQPVPASCFDDPIHANQITQANGYYKFDLNFSDASRCAQGDEYEIQLQPPANDFTGTTSVIIPPVEAATGGVALDVRNCPGSAADKIPATAQHCENSGSESPPPASIAPRSTGTDYNLKFVFNAANFTGQIYNNHIPVDGILEAAVAISKVASKLNVTRSDLVPYTITFNNTLGVPLFDVSIIDNFPAGFKYVTSSARVDGVAIEPQVNGRLLTWSNLRVDINESRVIKLLLIVGSGVGEGEYVNTARAIDSFTNQAVSGVASATVRVIPDPTFDCSDVIGKVFDDKNLNTYQDEGERGIAGVQVATARGLRVTTDSHGRFHITCAVVANEVRGSNFILKLDERTLPSGYRVTTENPRVQRATRGKMLKFNFGTSIHRVVRLDLADGVFEKGQTNLRPQWRSRIELLITELQKEGSILRLSYLAENEDEDEVDDRLDAIEELVSDRWQELDCCYKLVIEKEVFWRKGGPNAGREFK